MLLLSSTRVTTKSDFFKKTSSSLAFKSLLEVKTPQGGTGKSNLQARTSRQSHRERAHGSCPKVAPRERGGVRLDPHLPVSVGGVVPPVGLLVVVGLVGVGVGAAAAAAAPHMGAHLVAQVGARLCPRHPAQGVDARVGPAVDAHGSGGADRVDAGRGAKRGDTEPDPTAGQAFTAGSARRGAAAPSQSTEGRGRAGSRRSGRPAGEAGQGRAAEPGGRRGLLAAAAARA